MAESWVRVESEGELRAGMLIRFGCIWCPSMSIGCLVKPVALRHEHPDQLSRHSTVWRFQRMSCCCAETENRVAVNGSRLCVLWCIKEGLLMRLALSEPATTSEATRELADARGGGR